MAHGHNNKKYVRKATRVGKWSLSVVLPAYIVDEMGIRERQKLEIRRRGDEVVIRDWES
jgi:bifunctional DNA-binding transcriptional regulator/antitoxin component of YhaV-PrlF toxin-antitoxin module